MEKRNGIKTAGDDGDHDQCRRSDTLGIIKKNIKKRNWETLNMQSNI